MALTQVSGDFNFFGATEGAALDGPESVDDNLPMNGIKNTTSMLAKNYQSATAVVNYTPEAPLGTSGWFLPCAGQFYKACTAMCGAKEWSSHDISTDGMVASGNFETLFNATGYENVLPVSTAFCNVVGSVRYLHGNISTNEIILGYFEFQPLTEDPDYEEGNTSARPFLAF